MGIFNRNYSWSNNNVLFGVYIMKINQRQHITKQGVVKRNPSFGHLKNMRELKAYIRGRGLIVVRKPAKEMYGYAGFTEEDAKRWGIPMGKNEIWIDATIHGRYYFEILRHEVQELELVRSGKKMWVAHKIATRNEKR